MAYIYEAVNPDNQKRYIGFTSNTIDVRKMQHARDANRYRHLKFSRAILKYGIDHFVFNILEESDDVAWLLNERESYWIKHHDTTNDSNGYNICSGGRGRVGTVPWNKGIPHTQDAKEKMRQSTLGHVQSKETIEKRRKKLVGQKRSDETRTRMSSTWEITIPTGEVVVIKNLQQFCRDNNLTASCMINVANGVRTHHKQYRCRRITNGPQSRR